MESSFVADDSLLEETARVEDLLNLDTTVDYYEKRIRGIKRSGILAVLGPFGSGKSTVLYQVEMRMKDKPKDGVTWINFDAWKYPERKDLWEGFILDFAYQIGVRKEAQQKIEGRSQGYTAGEIVASIAAGLSGLGGIVEGVSKLFKEAPATRVFELQSLLQQMIEKQGRDTIIVVEDVDRSGDFGLRFLETLREFLHGLKIEHKCVVIAPIGDSEFEDNQRVYLKCIDYFDRFRLREVKLETFVDKVFRPDLFEGEFKDHNKKTRWTGVKRRGQICSFLEALLRDSSGINMRTIKLILRSADQMFAQQVNDGFEPDFRATIGFEASKYIMDGSRSQFERFQVSGSVDGHSYLGALLYSMALNRDTILNAAHPGEKAETNYSPVDIKLAKYNGKQGYNEFIPWYWENLYTNREEGGAQHGVNMSDFYLNY